MKELYLPTLHSFAMNNIFTGSLGLLRFRIVPTIAMNGKEVDTENSSMTAMYWHGIFCFEKSEMEGQCVFPLTEEGRAEMKAWLEAQISDLD